MKTLLKVTLVLALFLSLPLFAIAMSHEDKPMDPKMDMDHKMESGSAMHEKMMEKGGMEGQGGMMMHGDMMMLGEETVDGVRAMAHLKDVHDAMAKMNMTQTHHFMVMFADAKAGKSIVEGLVGVQITDPSGKTTEPIQLMGMQGHFGDDVTLNQTGTYKFDIRTKFMDGQKRQFEFQYEVK